jgi:hypothetical protein
MTYSRTLASDSRLDVASAEGSGAAYAATGSAIVAAAATFALMISVTFVESFTSAHLMVVLVALMLVHVVLCPRLFVCRELVLYAAFVGYMTLSLAWTADIQLALNTLFPAVDFVLTLLLFGSLAAFHSLRAVAGGVLAGFLVGAALYTYVEGFPFVYPEAFSYNAIAGMYLFGLFAALLFGWAWNVRLVPVLLALLILLHIAATTSIKANLGVLLGALAAALMYRRQFWYAMRRNLVALACLTALISYAALSSPTVRQQIEAGFARVSIGLKVLQARGDVPGYQGYGERERWMEDGLAGWTRNPLFGNGVEAFRDRFEATSHSTPIDLLFNSGLIGLGLFYAVLTSLFIRTLGAFAADRSALGALVLATLVCNFFVSLSSIAHYSGFLAAFIALSVPLLRRSVAAR